MKLYEQLQQLVTLHSDFWDYYRIHRRESLDSFFDEPSSFIRRTFEHASKRLLVSADYTNGHLRELHISKARAAHSLSSFFIGALIAHRLFDGMLGTIYTDNERTKPYSFSYIWTLTCLYHDYGYNLEKNKRLAQRLARAVNTARTKNKLKERANQSPYWLGMADFRKELNIRQSIWNTQPQSNNCRQCRDRQNLRRRKCVECLAVGEITSSYRQAPKTLYFGNAAIVIPIHFPKRRSNEISRYFAFRLLSFESIYKSICIDHGIAGGYLFFDTIINNYARAYSEASANRNIEISDFYYPSNGTRLMHFSFNQLPIFAYIADCIINHNIWSAKTGTEYEVVYKEMGMVKLLDSEYDKINFFKNPLLFILAISDSIEPYKLLSDLPIDVEDYDKNQLVKYLKNYSLRINGDKIIIESELLADERILKLQELQDWVDVKIERNDQGVVIIPCHC